MTSSTLTADAENAPQADLTPPAPPSGTSVNGSAPMPAYVPIALWIALAVVAVLCNVLALDGRSFLWTDRDLVANNAYLGTLGGLQRIWTGLLNPAEFSLSQYAPLAQVTFFAERWIWGDFAGGYRFTSCLLHATTGLMLWYVLRRLALPGAAIVAFLFVAHPIAGESVGLLSERRTILASFFALASSFLLLRAVGAIAPVAGAQPALPTEPSRLCLLAAVLFVLGLFASPAIATVPALVLLIAWWRRRGFDLLVIGTCLALTIAGLVMLSMTASIERQNTNAPSSAWPRANTAAGDLAVRTEVAGRAAAFYAGKIALPYPVMTDYRRWETPQDVARRVAFATPEEQQRLAHATPDVSPGDLLDWAWPLAIVVVVAGLAIAAPQIGRGPVVAVGGFVLLLLPVLGFVDLGWMQYAFVADRAAYLATAFALAGVVALIAPWITKPDQQTTFYTTVAIVLAAYIGLSINYSRRYNEPRVFWQAAADGARGNARSYLARMEYAKALLAADKPEFAAAADTLENARRLRPADPAVHLAIGHAFAQVGRPDDAMNKYAYVIDQFPDDVRGYLAAGDMQRQLANAKPTDPVLRRYAFNYYRDAVVRDPSSVEAQLSLGETAYDIVARLPQNDPQIPELLELAASSFNEAVQRNPYNVDNLVRMSRVLVAMGRLSDAGNLLNSARTMQPQRAEIHELIGDAALLARDIRGAEAAMRQAAKVDEDALVPRLKLGAFLQSQSRFDEALPMLEGALRIDPENAEAQLRLAEVKAKQSDSIAISRPGLPLITRPTTTPATQRS